MLFCGIAEAHAQRLAVKSNLLYDATTTVNLALEAGFSARWSVDLSGNLNPWTFSGNRKVKHWLVQPEIRRWNCEAFNRGFWGVHLLADSTTPADSGSRCCRRSAIRATRDGWSAAA